jgi:hypothetical protein
MGKIADLQLADDTGIDQVADFLEAMEDAGYTTTEMWSQGIIEVRERENQTLEESTDA